MSRKYPISMFLAGFLMYLIRFGYLLLISIIFFVVRIFNESIPVFVPLLILAAWADFALINQTWTTHKTLTLEDELLDELFTEDGRGRENLMDFVKKKFEEQAFKDEQIYDESEEESEKNDSGEGK